MTDILRARVESLEAQTKCIPILVEIALLMEEIGEGHLGGNEQSRLAREVMKKLRAL